MRVGSGGRVRGSSYTDEQGYRPYPRAERAIKGYRCTSTQHSIQHSVL